MLSIQILTYLLIGAGMMKLFMVLWQIVSGKISFPLSNQSFEKQAKRAKEKFDASGDPSLITKIKVWIGVRWMVREFLVERSKTGKDYATIYVKLIPLYNKDWNQYYRLRTPTKLGVTFSSNPEGFVTLRIR